jgi:hypothetical protein
MRGTSFVIPAKAGIQLKMMCAAHDTEQVLCASHSVFKLDSGVRRNDGEASVYLSQAGMH